MTVKESQRPTLARSLLDALNNALSAIPAAALLATPTLRLWSAGPAVVGPDQVPADFTECTFAGYAAVVLPALSGNLNLASSQGRGRLSSGLFTASAAIVPPGQSAVGYSIDNGAAVWYMGERFDTAVPFVSGGDFLELIVLFATAFTVLQR